MWTRERLNGFMNPLFWSTDYKRLGATKPSQFKSHQYAPASKNSKAYQLSGLTEWRAVGGDSVKLVKVHDFYNPDDPDFLQKVLYGG